MFHINSILAQTCFLSENVANLTAGIHAGFFSVHPTPRSNVPPVQEPSAITIRDSPPLQYRRPGPSTVTFGGGGRFSGGYFSGLVASGLHSFRELTQGTRFGQRDPAEQTLEQLFLEWTNTSRRHPQNNFMARPGINADAGPLFAAMFDFGPPQPTGSTSQSSYVELDSHPHRVKSGFAKEIIPLDREIYNLDSDSSTLSPVKQESKPVCASCDIPLLLGQESTSEASDGRRPWILACGHVVDSKCLEEARQRARHERKARYEKVKTKSRAKGGRGRGRKRNNRSLGSIHEFTLTSVLHGPSSPSIISTPTKRPRLSSQVSNSTPSDVGSNSGLPSDGVSTRTTRARAREARKSADTTSASPQVSRKFLDHCTPLRASPLDTQPPETDTVTQLNKGKGKQVEHKEWRPEHPSPSLLEPVTCEVNGNTIMSIELPPFDLDLPLMLTWIQCPVKSCQGPKGDVLAKKGSKKAPWEMFV